MKSYVRLSQVFCIIACFTIAILLSACKDYRKTLPNGYELFRTSPREVAIINRKFDKSIIIFPHIDGYTVMGDLVVGHVSKPDIGHVRYEVTPGYFVLDTKNEKVYKELGKEEWHKLLKNYGITEEPVLQRSTGLDKNY